MKLLHLLGSIIVRMVFIIFLAVVATFFITIFNADGVQRAIELIKSLM